MGTLETRRAVGGVTSAYTQSSLEIVVLLLINLINVNVCVYAHTCVCAMFLSV